MNDWSYATDLNIKRFRNLLETSVDETERRTIQRLLTEESSHQGGARDQRKLREATLSARASLRIIAPVQERERNPDPLCAVLKEFRRRRL